MLRERRLWPPNQMAAPSFGEIFMQRRQRLITKFLLQKRSCRLWAIQFLDQRIILQPDNGS